MSQVYDRDYLSGAVAFKVAGLGPDALAHGVQRYTVRYATTTSAAVLTLAHALLVVKHDV